MTSYEALWVPWWYGLRVCDPSSKKVFSIHSVLKVASQNRIFASGMYRQFPAPDFNRLVAMLPRHTVRSLLLLSANTFDDSAQRGVVNSQMTGNFHLTITVFMDRF